MSMSTTQDKAQHTPGPWKWAKSYSGLTYIYDANGRVIARVFRPDGMTIPRHHYNPTPTQRARLRLKAMLMRLHLREFRAEREAREQLKRIGWSDSAAAELATIGTELARKT
jgi:hypothetical protein